MLNQHNLPSTTALRYFIESAKYFSFTKASEELHVTQAAISKQVKQLEELLGVNLFIREKQRIYLSATGEIYYKDALRILRELEKLNIKIRTYNNQVDEIHIGILPTFSSRFLIPLLPKLYTQHPEIRIKLTTELGKIDFSQQPYDLVISFNEVMQDDVVTFNIMDETLIPVASPKLIEQDRLTLNQLEKIPLLTFLARPNLWNDWFASVNRSAPAPKSGFMFENFQMLIHATIASLGVALIPEFMIAHDLKSGLLKQIHSRTMHSKSQYFMAIPNEKMQDEKIIKFKEWLIQEIKTNTTYNKK
ncbi:MAG: LysR substrate-binding domain-containing protein [Ostreibacterium sp.]